MIKLNEQELDALESLTQYMHRGEAEQIGYATASGLCKTRGYSPEALLLVVLAAGLDLSADDSPAARDKVLSEAYAGIGVLRWCLDQRPKLH